MKPDDAITLLKRAGERARKRPEFLGWVLAQYEALEALEGGSLREQLRVAAEDWSQLQLCLRPRANTFLSDITEIAQAFGIERATLAAVIRRVDALEIVRKGEQPGRAGSLLAARTRKHNRHPRKPEASGDE